MLYRQQPLTVALLNSYAKNFAVFPGKCLKLFPGKCLNSCFYGILELELYYKQDSQYKQTSAELVIQKSFEKQLPLRSRQNPGKTLALYVSPHKIIQILGCGTDTCSWMFHKQFIQIFSQNSPETYIFEFCICQDLISVAHGNPLVSSVH